MSDPRHGTVTDVSGDVALALVAVTLLARPVLMALGRPTPGHLAWRRDVGLGAGMLALAHVWCGLRIHFGGDVLRYFAWTADPRFLAANVTGALAAAGLAAAVLTSNRPAMRRLRGRRWKRIQRLVLPAMLFSLAHTLLYVSLNGPLAVAAVGAAVVTAVLVLRGRPAVAHALRLTKVP